MSPEVAKLAYRCIINCLGGRKEEFERLVHLAMQLNGELTCKHCGGLLVSCRYGSKKNKKSGYFCTTCGQIESEGIVIKEGKRVC